jgi:hypothetical protein
MFFSFLCFAEVTEKEKAIDAEFKQLNDEIITPISNRFDEFSSLTRLISEEMIKMQKNGLVINDTPDNLLKAKEIAKATIRKRIGNERYMALYDTVPGKCDQLTKRPVSAPPFNGSKQIFQKDLLAKLMEIALTYNSANCAAQMRFTVMALKFNWMNKKRLNQPLMFKKMVVVQADPKTGDHLFVLVEGKDGTIFAVDPWFRKVKKVDGATKLSDIASDEMISPYPKPELLTNLFAEFDDNGKVYYDQIYVSEKTQWRLRWDITIGFETLANTYDPAPKQAHQVGDLNYIAHMEDIYNMLKNNMKFTDWTSEYDKLPFTDSEKPKRYEDDRRDDL